MSAPEIGARGTVHSKFSHGSLEGMVTEIQRESVEGRRGRPEFAE